MASSDLTLALLGGGMGGAGGMFSPYGMAMYNPQLIGPMQQLQFGQGLAQQGLSSAPAYPMQAISRLGQSIIGAMMMKEGFQGLQGAGQGPALGDVSNWIENGSAPATTQAPTAEPSATPQPSITLAAATHQLESGGSMKPGITGDGGKAAGPMQVHQGALDDVNAAMGTNYTLDQLTANPEIGKHVGDVYLALQQQKFPGHPELALAAYNAGPGATQKAVESGQGIAALPASTQQYVQRGLQLAQGGAPAEPQQPAIGMSNPDVQKWVTQQNRARQILAAHPFPLDPYHQMAQQHLDQATEMLTIGAVQQTPYGSVNKVTGQITYQPSWRPTTTESGDTYAIGPGGQKQLIYKNPTGLTGTAPETNVLRAITTIAPLIQAGTATPQQRAVYDAAIHSYMGAQIHEDPQTHQLISVPLRMPPEGFPLPASMAPLQPTSPQVPSVPPPSAPQAAPVPAVPTVPGGPTPQAGPPPAPAPAQAPPAAQAPAVPGVTPLTQPGAPESAVNQRYEQYQKLQQASIEARDELQQAQLLRKTLHDLGATGPAIPFLAKLSSYAKEIGVDDKTLAQFSLPSGATEAEAEALSMSLAMEVARKEFPQRVTNTDLRAAQSIKPNPAMPMGAPDYLLDNAIIPRAQRDVDLFNSVVNLTNPKHPDFDPTLGSMSNRINEFNKAHSLSSYTPALNKTAAEPAVQPTGQTSGVAKQGAPITAIGPGGKRLILQNNQWVPM